jgi:hypothetical protein
VEEEDEDDYPGGEEEEVEGKAEEEKEAKVDTKTSLRRVARCRVLRVRDHYGIRSTHGVPRDIDLGPDMGGDSEVGSQGQAKLARWYMHNPEERLVTAPHPRLCTPLSLAP